ncbi:MULTISPECIES: LytR/AlgR family response regulator transcription factor [Priestia]|uniref:LytR/AlgR family response regulator transcription factor n=1 Tax=Priestia TaxID=2800373 RepID=UPI000BF7A7E4|nr:MULTISPECIES: LytTR family DNA-binding domain-containing protein [Priestia]MBX9993286.1 response regulator transcription factor [Priestia aryabhattai]PFD99467.1 DNA-binding response regulator [Priestia megaterium]
MNKINLIIADDNEDSVEILDYFIEQLPEFEVISTCKDGEQLVQEVMAKSPDLLLVDINMPTINGVDAIKKCLRIKPNLNFIFITGYDEFAVKAFELSALDYIVKPIEKTRLYMALERAKNSIGIDKNQSKKPGEQLKRLPVKFNGSTYYIPIDQIIFIEKSGKKCLIYTQSRVYETYENISDIYIYLNPSVFSQTHRSYIVNLQKVSHITPKNETYLVYFLEIDEYAHISKLKIQDVQKQLHQLMTN